MDILKGIAIKDPNIKIIINARKFEAIWSIYYGIIQPDADAVVLIFADLQDTQNLIVDFIKKWEEGYHIVKGIKTSSEENWFFRTYTVENSSSSLSAKQCSKVDKYQSNKNSKP